MLARFVVAVPGVALLAVVTTPLVVFPAQLNGPVIYGLDLFVSLLVAEGIYVPRRGLRPALYYRHRPGGGHLRLPHVV